MSSRKGRKLSLQDVFRDATRLTHFFNTCDTTDFVRLCTTSKSWYNLPIELENALSVGHSLLDEYLILRLETILVSFEKIANKTLYDYLLIYHYAARLSNRRQSLDDKRFVLDTSLHIAEAADELDMKMDYLLKSIHTSNAIHAITKERVDGLRTKSILQTSISIARTHDCFRYHYELATLYHKHYHHHHLLRSTDDYEILYSLWRHAADYNSHDYEKHVLALQRQIEILLHMVQYHTSKRHSSNDFSPQRKLAVAYADLGNLTNSAELLQQALDMFTTIATATNDIHDIESVATTAHSLYHLSSNTAHLEEAANTYIVLANHVPEDHSFDGAIVHIEQKLKYLLLAIDCFDILYSSSSAVDYCVIISDAFYSLSQLDIGTEDKIEFISQAIEYYQKYLSQHHSKQRMIQLAKYYEFRATLTLSAADYYSAAKYYEQYGGSDNDKCHAARCYDMSGQLTENQWQSIKFGKAVELYIELAVKYDDHTSPANKKQNVVFDASELFLLSAKCYEHIYVVSNFIDDRRNVGVMYKRAAESYSSPDNGTESDANDIKSEYFAIAAAIFAGLAVETLDYQDYYQASMCCDRVANLTSNPELRIEYSMQSQKFLVLSEQQQGLSPSGVIDRDEYMLSLQRSGDVYFESYCMTNSKAHLLIALEKYEDYVNCFNCKNVDVVHSDAAVIAVIDALITIYSILEPMFSSPELAVERQGYYCEVAFSLTGDTSYSQYAAWYYRYCYTLTGHMHFAELYVMYSLFIALKTGNIDKLASLCNASHNMQLTTIGYGYCAYANMLLCSSDLTKGVKYAIAAAECYFLSWSESLRLPELIITAKLYALISYSLSCYNEAAEIFYLLALFTSQSEYFYCAAVYADAAIAINAATANTIEICSDSYLQAGRCLCTADYWYILIDYCVAHSRISKKNLYVYNMQQVIAIAYDSLSSLTDNPTCYYYSALYYLHSIMISDDTRPDANTTALHICILQLIRYLRSNAISTDTKHDAEVWLAFCYFVLAQDNPLYYEHSAYYYYISALRYKELDSQPLLPYILVTKCLYLLTKDQNDGCLYRELADWCMMCGDLLSDYCYYYTAGMCYEICASGTGDKYLSVGEAYYCAAQFSPHSIRMHLFDLVGYFYGLCSRTAISPARSSTTGHESESNDEVSVTSITLDDVHVESDVDGTPTPPPVTPTPVTSSAMISASTLDTPPPGVTAVAPPHDPDTLHRDDDASRKLRSKGDRKQLFSLRTPNEKPKNDIKLKHKLYNLKTISNIKVRSKRKASTNSPTLPSVSTAVPGLEPCVHNDSSSDEEFDIMRHLSSPESHACEDSSLLEADTCAVEVSPSVYDVAGSDVTNVAPVETSVISTLASDDVNAKLNLSPRSPLSRLSTTTPTSLTPTAPVTTSPRLSIEFIHHEVSQLTAPSPESTTVSCSDVITATLQHAGTAVYNDNSLEDIVTTKMHTSDVTINNADIDAKNVTDSTISAANQDVGTHLPKPATKALPMMETDGDFAVSFATWSDMLKTPPLEQSAADIVNHHDASQGQEEMYYGDEEDILAVSDSDSDSADSSVVSPPQALYSNKPASPPISPSKDKMSKSAPSLLSLDVTERTIGEIFDASPSTPSPGRYLRSGSSDSSLLDVSAGIAFRRKRTGTNISSSSSSSSSSDNEDMAYQYYDEPTQDYSSHSEMMDVLDIEVSAESCEYQSAAMPDDIHIQGSSSGSSPIAINLLEHASIEDVENVEVGDPVGLTNADMISYSPPRLSIEFIHTEVSQLTAYSPTSNSSSVHDCVGSTAHSKTAIACAADISIKSFAEEDSGVHDQIAVSDISIVDSIPLSANTITTVVTHAQHPAVLSLAASEVYDPITSTSAPPDSTQGMPMMETDSDFAVSFAAWSDMLKTPPPEQSVVNDDNIRQTGEEDFLAVSDSDSDSDSPILQAQNTFNPMISSPPISPSKDKRSNSAPSLLSLDVTERTIGEIFDASPSTPSPGRHLRSGSSDSSLLDVSAGIAFRRKRTGTNISSSSSTSSDNDDMAYQYYDESVQNHSEDVNMALAVNVSVESCEPHAEFAENVDNANSDVLVEVVSPLSNDSHVWKDIVDEYVESYVELGGVEECSQHSNAIPEPAMSYIDPLDLIVSSDSDVEHDLEAELIISKLDIPADMSGDTCPGQFNIPDTSTHENTPLATNILIADVSPGTLIDDDALGEAGVTVSRLNEATQTDSKSVEEDVVEVSSILTADAVTTTIINEYTTRGESPFVFPEVVGAQIADAVTTTTINEYTTRGESPIVFPEVVGAQIADAVTTTIINEYTTRGESPILFPEIVGAQIDSETQVDMHGIVDSEIQTDRIEGAAVSASKIKMLPVSTDAEMQTDQVILDVPVAMSQKAPSSDRQNRTSGVSTSKPSVLSPSHTRYEKLRVIRPSSSSSGSFDEVPCNADVSPKHIPVSSSSGSFDEVPCNADASPKHMPVKRQLPDAPVSRTTDITKGTSPSHVDLIHDANDEQLQREVRENIDIPANVLTVLSPQRSGRTKTPSPSKVNLPSITISTACMDTTDAGTRIATMTEKSAPLKIDSIAVTTLTTATIPPSPTTHQAIFAPISTSAVAAVSTADMYMQEALDATTTSDKCYYYSQAGYLFELNHEIPAAVDAFSSAAGFADDKKTLLSILLRVYRHLKLLLPTNHSVTYKQLMAETCLKLGELVSDDKTKYFSYAAYYFEQVALDTHNVSAALYVGFAYFVCAEECSEENALRMYGNAGEWFGLVADCYIASDEDGCPTVTIDQLCKVLEYVLAAYRAAVMISPTENHLVLYVYWLEKLCVYSQESSNYRTASQACMQLSNCYSDANQLKYLDRACYFAELTALQTKDQSDMQICGELWMEIAGIVNDEDLKLKYYMQAGKWLRLVCIAEEMTS